MELHNEKNKYFTENHKTIKKIIFRFVSESNSQ